MQTTSPVSGQIFVPGQSELLLPMRRWVDMRERGYYSGDVHVHFLDPTTATLEAAAEDLNVTELLAIQQGRLYEGLPHGIVAGGAIRVG